MIGLSRLVAYCRTSTVDQQSPEDSKAWQLARIRDVIAGRAEILRVVHDTDTTRAIPWERREQAGRLLRELTQPERGWDGVVVGETARAFGNAMQAQLVLLRLEHFGAQLWAPEVGGPVDADSEAHDILLNLFGGLSKAERQRLKIRVRSAMRQMASTGRWLGGRPPYGYRLVSTGLTHPNPELARYGVELHRLEPDPGTAPVVSRTTNCAPKDTAGAASPAASTTTGSTAPRPPIVTATPTAVAGRGRSAPYGPS